MHISFIIPVYNVEKYVEKAIMSVVNNNWGEYEFEIVIVDDESPDNSVEIIKNIKTQYPEVSINIISQKNKGLGGARNTGVDNATGDYLFFLDSDDYILQGVFVDLLSKAYKNNLDVLEFAAKRVDEKHELIDEVFLLSTNGKVLSGDQYITEVSFANSACNKLYKREFLQSENIRFIERVYIEDAPFNVEVFLKAQRVEACDTIAAAYLQNTSSITRSKRSGQYLEKFIADSITVTARIFELSKHYQTHKAQQKIKTKAAFFTAGILRMILVNNTISVQQKQTAYRKLQENNLMPFYHPTGSYVRTCFLYAANMLFPIIKKI